ncbi:hypothetical protein EMIHUDRAFT_69011, partial [Emiliania huxleyi CCMP1516]|uniref:Uncharacterized protein n=2 Tax=Emiliania huxleyi TaxID=2903 RepID=A0A0D3I143_EMIH1
TPAPPADSCTCDCAGMPFPETAHTPPRVPLSPPLTLALVTVRGCLSLRPHTHRLACPSLPR